MELLLGQMEESISASLKKVICMVKANFLLEKEIDSVVLMVTSSLVRRSKES